MELGFPMVRILREDFFRENKARRRRHFIQVVSGFKRKWVIFSCMYNSEGDNTLNIPNFSLKGTKKSVSHVYFGIIRLEDFAWTGLRLKGALLEQE